MNASIVAVVVCAIAVAAVFVWLNRKHANKLDHLEQLIRDFNKKDGQ